MELEVKTIENQEKDNNKDCGCGSGGCGYNSKNTNQTESYIELSGRFQFLETGDRVVEFGSGTGGDCITAAKVVGPTGKVIGIDMSDKNINEARQKSDSLKLDNVEFRLGNIEAAPVPAEFANVVYSTCVFNLQTNKQKVADEMYRVCDHNGYACVSDFVIINEIPDDLRREASEIAGCIAGAENVEVFMNYFRKTGFTAGGIVEVNKVQLPIELLEKYLDDEMIKNYNDIDSDYGIFNVLLVVEKPETCNAETCCHNVDKHMN